MFAPNPFFRHISLAFTGLSSRNFTTALVLARERQITRDPTRVVRREFLGPTTESPVKPTRSSPFVEVFGDQRRNPFSPHMLPEEVKYEGHNADLTPDEKVLADGMISEVNRQITEESHGRLFAVIFMGYKQWRVTEGDIIMIQGTYHLALGQKVKLEKVLAVGSRDFTLLGRPMLDRGLVSIHATCIEKSQAYPMIFLRHFKQIPRKLFRCKRVAQTMIRINRIAVNRKLNDLPNSDEVVHNVA